MVITFKNSFKYLFKKINNFKINTWRDLPVQLFAFLITRGDKPQLFYLKFDARILFTFQDYFCFFFFAHLLKQTCRLRLRSGKAELTAPGFRVRAIMRYAWNGMPGRAMQPMPRQ